MNPEPGTFRLVAIAAMASNRVIGKEGGLPWHIPEDLKWFKERTLDHPIVMGRKTFESFPGLLPRRRHIVLSRSLPQAPPGVDLISSPDELASLDLQGDVFVIGGAAVYELLLKYCAELYLTVIHKPHEGDTLFPPFEDRFSLEKVIDSYPEFDRRLYRNDDPATL